MTVANYVTFARIAFIPLIIWFLAIGLNGLAAIAFLLLSSSDAIDGYIARKFNQISEVGKFLDPLADKILVISVLIMLVSEGLADPLPIIILTAREFMVQGIRIQAANSGKIIAASLVAKFKTVVQIVATAMLILQLPAAKSLLWLAVITSLISGGAYLWQSKILKSLK
ncbi:MAG: CDP-diacylglycerol--glycerol-3-phosphate 3-phosphatidyltransferase [bacterium]